MMSASLVLEREFSEFDSQSPGSIWSAKSFFCGNVLKKEIGCRAPEGQRHAQASVELVPQFLSCNELNSRPIQSYLLLSAAEGCALKATPKLDQRLKP